MTTTILLMIASHFPPSPTSTPSHSTRIMYPPLDSMGIHLGHFFHLLFPPPLSTLSSSPLHSFLPLTFPFNNQRLREGRAGRTVSCGMTFDLDHQIVDTERLLSTLVHRCPALRYLSLLGNQACPNELLGSGHDDEDYQRYR